MKQQGTTLIELIVALALAAIVVSFGVSFIAAPVQTLQTANQREQLAQEAGMVSIAMGRDLRAALPGSIRVRTVGGVVAIELLRVVDGTSALPDALATSAAQRLDLGVGDASFETLGSFPLTTLPVDSRKLLLATVDPGGATNPYGGTGIITPVGTRIRIGPGSVPEQSLIRVTPAVRYDTIGTQRMLYLLSGPVTWLCEPATGRLRRFSGYTMAANQAQRDSAAKLMAAGAQVGAVADNLSGCQLTQQVLVTARQSAVTVVVELSRGGAIIASGNSAVLDDAL